MKQKISNSKLIFITMMVAVTLASGGNNFFLRGTFIDIPKGTTEGAVIIFTGTLGILIISVLVSLGVMLVLKKLTWNKKQMFQN